MPRVLTSGMLAAVTSQNLQPALFVELAFRDNVIRVWSGRGSTTFNGHTWSGIGSFGAISTIDEGTTVEARGITLTMSGIDPTMLAEALQEIELGAPVTVYLGMFDGSSLIADPVVSWSGRLDQSTFEIGGESATLSINCESRLLDMNVAVDRRYTFDDQQIDHPGDLGLMFVTSIQEKTIFWGTGGAIDVGGTLLNR